VSLLPTSHFDLIVIGGGVAGIQASLEAKKLQPRKSVALVTDEIITYSRPSLTAVISGAVNDVDRIGIFSPETLKSSGIQLLSGHEISEIEHPAHTVYMKKIGQKQSGSASPFNYEKLVIATGAIPLVPRTEGGGLTGVFTVRKFQEALAASKFISSGMTAHVVGAGFVGLDTAEALARRRLSVTLIVRSRILRGILEQDLSQALVDRAQMHGVKILNGVTLERIEGNRKVERVVIDEKALKSDVVIFATGVEPDTKLAQSMGLVTARNGAIRTDKSMQTNLNGVYATGDCSESIDFVSGKSVYRPLGSIAALTAKIAGANAVGVEKIYEGIIRRQYNRIFDTEIISIGLSTEEAKNHNIKAKAFKVRIKKPELLLFPQLVSKNLMRVIVNEDTDAVIGWQAIGIRQTSLFSHYFHDCIFNRRKLEDVNASGQNIELVLEQK
jgi:NADPH-dependent 2,4-dienoyl-CoA reductase/sulfur reductase-like enzyme